MKPEQQNLLGVQGVLSQPGECSVEGLQPPEIVGQVENPVLEAIRRLWWRAFDRVCDLIVLIRLSIYDRIFGPEPPILADIERESDHERLVSDFPMSEETTKPINTMPGKTETAI
jgi:hypothetical protein